MFEVLDQVMGRIADISDFPESFDGICHEDVVSLLSGMNLVRSQRR